MAEAGDIFRKFRAPTLLDISDKLKREDDYWSVDGFEGREGANSYDQTFKDLFRKDENNLVGLLRARKSRGVSSHVLDVMGGGFFLPPEAGGVVDSVTGFRLENPTQAMKQSLQTELDLFRSSPHEHFKQMIPKYEKYLADLEQLPSALNHTIVSGSAFDNQAWGRLKADMHKRNVPHFDVVICRPVAPFQLVNIRPQDKEFSDAERQSYHVAYLQLMSKALDLVSRDGVVLTQIPEVFTLEEAEKWKGKLTKNKPFMKVEFAQNRRGAEDGSYVARIDIHK